ncbi:tyrosine-type recombinase/integrase [Streptomyces sp. RLB3-17]|uniref:tyrosine-type recombinase/integrase n=1 Tax=unclassified Streptomyces TaxID=2593676 RepID=UPI00116542D3|nr:tyrosine-type recombinase/integrase [Streptomyces sp. RLB3-17]QDO45818.1 tyrosine-type recombinase/integrase [Streptomyces sp. RLB3-17]
MALAVVRSIGSGRELRSEQEREDFEQELVDQYALAMVGAGWADSTIAGERGMIFEFLRFLGRSVWTAQPADADRFLAYQRRDRALAKSTVQKKALAIAGLYDFLLLRYQGDIHALTGHALVQPIDEFNRPARIGGDSVRVPPTDPEVEHLFTNWGATLPGVRKFLPAARNYFAASLWRRGGLRINETVMLDIRDWRPDLGSHGKLHVRYGKGSRGRGPKTRFVSAINSIDSLMNWWLTDIRHQFGDDWQRSDAPLLPSERRDPLTGYCTRVGDDALRSGLAQAVATWLPEWNDRLTPHGLRHYCASSLYLRGLDLKAIQELLGHEWLATTTRYIHVHNDHIERAWEDANERVTARFCGEAR